jgi:DNA integrity scanning protein DisA with diadenylate cyclase activity
MTHKKNLKKAFEKTKLIETEIETLTNEGQYVSAFVLKFLFLEQYVEILISLIYLKTNDENATELVELVHDDVSDTTFGHKVMYLQKLNKRFSLKIDEKLFQRLQKISSFRNKTVHRLLHSDVDIDVLNEESKEWLSEIDTLHEGLFAEYLHP